MPEKAVGILMRMQTTQLPPFLGLCTHASPKSRLQGSWKKQVDHRDKILSGLFFSSIGYLPKYYCFVGHLILLRWPSIIASLAKYTIMLRNRIFRLIPFSLHILQRNSKHPPQNLQKQKKESAFPAWFLFICDPSAERQGFEPWEQLPVHRISSAARLSCLSVSYRICSKVSLSLTLNFTCSTHNWCVYKVTKTIWIKKGFGSLICINSLFSNALKPLYMKRKKKPSELHYIK